jgi:type VI secretion system protein ImpJ
MSWNNKVIWSEGMFIRPQHFQQDIRYFESFIEERCSGLRNNAWGFRTLEIDLQLLSVGKLAISSATGVFPDGTPFNIPSDVDPPAPLDIPANTHDTVVYLGLPVRRHGMEEFDPRKDPKLLIRYFPAEYDVRDSNNGTDSIATVQIGRLRTCLLLGSDQREEYSCMGVARIIESRVDKNLILDDKKYIIPVLDCQASPVLIGFLHELQGLIRHRAEALAGRVAEPGRGGAAETADFLLLQVMNRYDPLIVHFTGLRGLHPETFYRVALTLAGELTTFTAQNRRCPQFPAYAHDDLQATLEPVMAELRRSLSMVIEPTAIPIPLEQRKFGIRVAIITDHSLLRQAYFVLAVRAAMPTEEIRTRFPKLGKIGPVEHIRQLVNLNLPGINVRPLPAAPRQIPFHADFVYFELDRSGEHWKNLPKSGGIAFFISGEFPDIEMEFWAIKR